VQREIRARPLVIPPQRRSACDRAQPARDDHRVRADGMVVSSSRNLPSEKNVTALTPGLCSPLLSQHVKRKNVIAHVTCSAASWPARPGRRIRARGEMTLVEKFRAAQVRRSRTAPTAWRVLQKYTSPEAR